MNDWTLVLFAFATRSSALVVLIMIAWRFRSTPGPLAQSFRHMFWTFIFLIAWVWVASVFEVIGAVRGASSLIETGPFLIGVPNIVITVSLYRLYRKLGRR